jgi:hypothetical protein
MPPSRQGAPRNRHEGSPGAIQGEVAVISASSNGTGRCGSKAGLLALGKL